MVMPLIILVFLSMMIYGVFQFTSFQKQVALHQNIINTVAESDRPMKYSTVTKSKTASINLGGLTGNIIKKTMKCSRYKMDKTKIVRLKYAFQ